MDWYKIEMCLALTMSYTTAFFLLIKKETISLICLIITFVIIADQIRRIVREEEGGDE